MSTTAHVSPDGRVRLHLEEPYFVTPHAIQRFRQRVRGFAHASDMEIVRIVMRGLQRAGPCYPPPRTIAVAERAAKPRFVAVIEPPPPGHEWPSVVTIWGWGICPFLLRRKRGMHGQPDKRYRWLNHEVRPR